MTSYDEISDGTKAWHIIGTRLKASSPLPFSSANYSECVVGACGNYHHLVYRSQNCTSRSEGENTPSTQDTVKPKFRND